MKTVEEVAEKLVKGYVTLTIGIPKEEIVSHFIRALTAYAEERVKEHEEELICEDCGYAGSRVKPSLKEARAEALEEAAKHFHPQIRTYTGEQVAKALLDIRDGKFMRALADRR